MTDLDLGIIAARGGEWADLAAEVLSLRERVPCTCATYYAVYEGPEEDCPEHGRTYAEWVERVDRLAETNARYRVSTDAVRALCEQRIAEHADYVRGVQDGTLITLDRFIGPAQVDVADVLAALDVRHDPSTTTDGGPPVPMPYDGPRIVSGPGPLGLDAIDPRKATPGQVADLIALVRAKESWIGGAKVDMAALEEAAAKATTWHMEALDDLAACVAERDEARAEVDRLRTLADDNWRSLEREATEHARTLGLIGQPKTGEPLSEGEQRRFEAAVERGLRKRAEDQRDDWRRRYEALRDGVTGLADRLTWKRPEHSPCGTPEQIEACCGSEQSCDAMNPSVLLCGASDLRAVVARVEGDES